MRDRLLNIINHFGVNSQLRKLNEENFEVKEAILDKENFNKYAPNADYYGSLSFDEYYEKLKFHIAEEITDNFLLLLQFVAYYNIQKEDLEEIFNFKLKRTEQRIKED